MTMLPLWLLLLAAAAAAMDFEAEFEDSEDQQETQDTTASSPSTGGMGTGKLRGSFQQLPTTKHLNRLCCLYILFYGN